jgi:hypothetical protein
VAARSCRLALSPRIVDRGDRIGIEVGAVLVGAEANLVTIRVIVTLPGTPMAK